MTDLPSPAPTLLAGGTRHGGTGDIPGNGNTVVTDARGPLRIGDINIGLDALDRLAEQVPRRRPVSTDRLERLAEQFVPPTGSGFGEAQAQLAKPGTVVISGEPGTGRHTAGLMLLHESGDGASSFQELAVNDDGEIEPDATTVQEQERLLLDLTGFGHRELTEIRTRVEVFRGEVEQRAYLVVVLPTAHRRTWGTDFGHELTIGCPDRRTVLHKHLEADDVLLPAELWSMPELGDYLQSGGMGKLAELAQQVRTARDRSDRRGDPRKWVITAVQALADQRESASKQVVDAGDGRGKALLFTTAMLHGASADEIFHSERRFLAAVKYPDSELHSLDDKDFTQRLTDLGVRVDDDHRVQIAELGLDAALRTYFWTSMPGERRSFRDWAARVVASRDVSGVHKREFVERFGEHALAVGGVEHVCYLVEQWTREKVPVNSHYNVFAGILLQLGLSHERQGQEFRRRFYDWATRPEIPTPLARLVVALSEMVIAPTHADQAVVRLRHLTRHSAQSVRSDAMAALLKLARQPRFWRRILHRLCLNLESERFLETDRELFSGLADLDLVLALRVVLRHRQVHDQLATCWRLLLADPLDSTPDLVERWIAARNPLLRRILVAAAAPDPKRLGYVYGVGHRWRAAAWEPVERSARDPVISDLRTAIDRALGLTFLDPAARPEDTGR